MTADEIKEIVSVTVDDLISKKLISAESELAYQFMNLQLARYYKMGERSDPKITYALKKLSNDPYAIMLPMYYRDGKTITAIAVTVGCDRATVSRNKKRLVMELYNECYLE